MHRIQRPGNWNLMRLADQVYPQEQREHRTIINRKHGTSN